MKHIKWQSDYIKQPIEHLELNYWIYTPLVKSCMFPYLSSLSLDKPASNSQKKKIHEKILEINNPII